MGSSTSSSSLSIVLCATNHSFRTHGTVYTSDRGLLFFFLFFVILVVDKNRLV